MKQQRGVAVITALLVVALVTAVTGFIAWRQQLWLRTVENQLNLAQARGIARAALNLVRAELQNDRNRDGKYDYPGEAWAVPIQGIPVEQGTAGGAVRDLQGRFNLNNLVDAQGSKSARGFESFQRLLALLQLPPELASALLDWEDKDAETVADGGAEDGYYLGLNPPYRAANQPLAELNNLYRVKGFTPEIVAKLAPFVCVLRKPAAVNVNFATATVLQAVLPGLASSDAALLVQKARNKPYENIDQLRQDLPDSVRDQAVEAVIDVRTDYFEAVTYAHFGNVTLSLTAQLSRAEQNFPQIVWIRRSDLAEKVPNSQAPLP